MGHARYLLTLFIVCIGLCFVAESAQANEKYASFVMDADTGMVLHQRYANKQLHPASLTKVMTLLLTFDALERGTLHLNDRIYVSKHAASMVPSKLGLAPGSSILVRDAIPAMMIKSANDVAVAMAEHLGGTESNFAHMMTRRAKEIGMTRTNFANASGLHHKYQISTARDMAKMAHYVIKEYPGYYKLFGRKSFTYAGQTYRSHNRLMESYSGMDGMKTGYTNASGFNLIASAVRDNHRLIGVVFGGKTSRSRNEHMAKLLDYGFKRLPEVRMASAEVPAPVPGRKPDGSVHMASVLNDIAPASGDARNALQQKPTQWASLNIGDSPIGQGDYDEGLTKRVNLGITTATAHSALAVGDAGSSIIDKAQNWAIQVGAFRSKSQGANALKTALQQLPNYYAQAKPMIIPLQTAKQKIYRARLSGYSSQDAYAACAYIKECIAIAP